MMEQSRGSINAFGGTVPSMDLLVAIAGKTDLLREWDGHLIISNCTIEGDFNIHLDFTSSYDNKKVLHFEKCTFTGQVDINNFIPIDRLTFDTCEFLSHFNLSNIKGIFALKGKNVFKQTAQFIFRHPTDDLSIYSINNTIFSKDIVIGGSVKSLTITNSSHFREPEDVSSSRLGMIFLKFECESISINESKFEALEFSGQATVKNNFAIQSCNFENINFDGLSIEDMGAIMDTTVSNFSLYSKNNHIDNLYFKNLTVTGFFRFRLGNIGQTTISNSALNNFSLWGLNSSTSFLTIEKTSIQRLEFERVVNQGQISLKEIDAKGGRLGIQSSNLGKTDFILCDFSKGILEFENSKLTEVFLSESDFPKIVFRGNDVSHRQAQLAFGQLNTAFQKQGDTVRALEYQAREMEAHYEDLKLCKRHTQTRYNLWLNKVSNNFGRSWVRGLKFTLGFGLLFFYFIVLNSKEYGFGFGFDYDERIGTAFLKFLNPLRFFDTDLLFKMSEKPFLTLNFWAYFFDLTGRIFLAYGIYQTVQAFRRYGRK